MANPVWSPDGPRLVYRGRPMKLYETGSADELKEVSTRVSIADPESWLPDGRSILLAASAPNNEDLLVMDLDSGETTT